jgi:AAA domain
LELLGVGVLGGYKLYRIEEKARVLAALKANGSILICGDEGSGKTVLMGGICAELQGEGFEVAIVFAASTQRQMLINICEQLEIEVIDLEGKVLTVEKLRWAVADYLRSNPSTFLVFDDAHQLEPKFRSWLKTMQRQGVSLLLVATRPPRTDVFLNTPALILRPLSDVVIRDLMTVAAEDRGLNLSQGQIASLQQRAGGNPALAIRSIDEEYLGLEVEAGDHGEYFDVTPLLVLVGTGCVMLRFFAIGTDSRLLYVVAGMSGALLLGVSYMLRILPKDSRRVS